MESKIGVLVLYGGPDPQVVSDKGRIQIYPFTTQNYFCSYHGE